MHSSQRLHRYAWSIGALLVYGTLGTAASRIGSHPHQVTYHLLHTYRLGGDGGWDYVAFDSVGHRLFIARQNRVMIVDPGRGTLLGEIPGLNGAHGIAFAYDVGHGFITSGRDSTVTMFDLKTLAVLHKTTAAPDADAILYDPASRQIFTFNGDSHSSTVIDPESGQRVGTIDLGATPEFAVADGSGKLYVNLTDQGAVAEVDAKARRVIRTWSVTPCRASTGLAIDRVTHRLFSGCRSTVMAISDAARGRLITTLPIGSGVDATAFDPRTRLAFSSNGDGTLTIVHEDDAAHFRVVQTVQTMVGARTMALDPISHQIYLVSAQFGTPPAGAAGTPPHRRPPIVPGSFTLLVLGPATP